MKNYIVEVKYSILGDYNSLESTPEIIMKLNSVFGEFNMIPSTLTLHDVSNSGIKVIYRPQFINPSNNSRIDILPDRIDFVFVSLIEEIDIATTRTKVLSILDAFDDEFKLPAVRFAIFVNGFIDGETKSYINQDEYYKDEQFVEWNVRSVHRKSIVISGRKESLNIVVTRSKQEDHNIVINHNNQNLDFSGMNYNIDINTFVPSNSGVFKMSDFNDFVQQTNQVAATGLDIVGGN